MSKNVLLTEQNVAELLQISVKTLQGQRWMKVGIPYLKIGRSVRYRPEDVERYLTDSVVKTVQVEGR